MGSVPVVTEDASADFVTQALRSTGVIDADTSVAEVEHDRIGEGVGLMCNLARLDVALPGPGAPRPVQRDPQGAVELPREPRGRRPLQLLRARGRFYAEISESLPVRTPHCYYNHMDLEANEFALMIEDFGGRTMVSQVAGIDAERAIEAVRALALVHAEWWLSPKLETVTWMPRAIDPQIISAGFQYRKVWDHFVELFADRMPDGAIELGERIGPSWEAVQTTLHERTPTTLCHGDFRADNLMFDDSATGREHVGILDWQIAYRSGGIGDVCYLATQSMTVEDRRAHERDLVDAWYDAVCSALGAPPDGYTAEQAWTDYRSATGNMTVYGVVAGGGLDPSNERGLELVTDMAARSFVAALDLDAASFIP
jgi:aminoglycoside/choline kinase family phosphotransferase